MNNCTMNTQEEFQVVAVSGEVDLSWSSDVREAILSAIQSSSQVLVDLSAVEYIDSSGIAALVEGYQTAKMKTVQFGLLNISAQVRSVLELARLDQVFPIHEDLAAARLQAG